MKLVAPALPVVFAEGARTAGEIQRKEAVKADDWSWKRGMTGPRDEREGTSWGSSISSPEECNLIYFPIIKALNYSWGSVKCHKLLQSSLYMSYHLL